MLRRSHQAGLAFIFFTILLEAMGLGLIIPVLPRLVTELSDSNPNEASLLYGRLIGVYALMLFLFGPFWGALSDRFGRRPILLISLFGQACDYVLMALAPALWWLVLGRVLSGILGASFSTAQAYIADTSTPEKRAQSFGLVGAAFGLGFVIGPALGGLIATWGTRAPFWAAAALVLINWLYGLLILPESLKPENRRKLGLRQMNPVAVLWHLRSYPHLGGIVAIFALISLAGQVMPSTWVLYCTHQFRWTDAQNGLSLAFVGLCVGLSHGFLTRLLIPRLGERKAIFTGLVAMIVSLVLYSLATEGWMMYAFIVIYAIGGLTHPSLQGLMTTQVDPSEQGRLQGALAGLTSIAAFAGPLLFTAAFAWGTHPDRIVAWPGAAFGLSAGLMTLGFVLSIVFVRQLRDLQRKPAHTPETE
jgi:DHA1 family tetracycline resistance protein-like MFS transporter